MTRFGALIGALVLWGIVATPAQAAPIFGGTLFATGGDVTVTFLSQGAGYTNELYLDGPTGDSLDAGDGGYDDLVFSFTNVGVAVVDPAAVDEPAALLLFGAGLAAFALVARRAASRRAGSRR